jgi:hypothetical protein
MRYNPIARNFYRIRRMLIEETGLPRNAVRPSMRLRDLIPRDARRRVHRRLLEDDIVITGLVLPWLGIDMFFLGRGCWITLATLLALPFWQLVVGLVGVVILLGIALDWFGDHGRVRFLDASLPLRDAVLLFTSAEDCDDAEYHLTRNEIHFKVRAIVAHVSGASLEEVTPETTLTELGVF